MTSPISQARIDAELDLDTAARRLRIKREYLQRLEANGSVPYVLAIRIAPLYRCSLTLLAQPTPRKLSKGGTATEKTRRKSMPGRERHSSPAATVIGAGLER